MDPVKKLRRKLSNKSKITEKDISKIASLPEKSMLDLSFSLTSLQQQKIYEALSTPKPPNWITKTIEIHNSRELKQTLPKIKESNNYKKVVEMVMISAGDFIPPDGLTVKFVYDNVKKFLKDHNRMSKKNLEEKFENVVKKYRNNGKIALCYDDSESEDESDGNEMKNVERLQFYDERTKNMTEKEYLYFTECRLASFLKFGKQKFMNWVGIKHSPKIFAWIAREKVFGVIEDANRRRNCEAKLIIIDSAILVDEIKF